MLIRPPDRATSDDEWRSFLSSRDFGELIAAGRAREVPVIVPTHFAYDGAATIRLHLARPNPAFAALAENPLAVISVFGAYTYIPGPWNAVEGTDVDHGVPTSYYAAVQAIVRCEIVDDAEQLAAILGRQLDHFQPEGHAAATDPEFFALFNGIRGVVCRIEEVHAKFKFGGNRTVKHRLRIADRLADRDGPNDVEARAQLLRRTTPIP
ncbi:MAG: FMN-binding negative transcriptional regulator [Chloroflexi bacterium]|nr:FMN-binding negative transcriptional regulator [Chloroflexota bacterium]